MTSLNRNAFPAAEVREDFVPKEDYVSPDFARLEEEYLWPHVWQMACREEEIPKPGDFVVYDIIDDSIVVVRGKDNQIRAFHNTCSHRGRKLVEADGNTPQFICKFHGWRYGLDGTCTHVVDRADWGQCLKKEEVDLKRVHVGIWGGCVFINMSANPEPFEKFIAPLPAKLDRFELEKLRFKWYKTVKLDLNWKLCLEFFNEFYHMQTTHRQMLAYMDEYSNTGAYGRHGAVWYPETTNYPLSRSRRLPPRPDGKQDDMRELIYMFAREQYEDVRTLVSERNFNAAKRIMAEFPPGSPPDVVFQKYVEYQLEAAKEDGAGWPEQLTPEYIKESHVDWHVFPNLIIIHAGIDSALWYRARPNGHDHNSCLFDVWSLERFGPGKAPKLNKQFFERWQDGDVGNILTQDFSNVEAMKGIRSRGFAGPRTSPIQERTISNFHRMLRDFIERGPQEDQLYKGGGPAMAAEKRDSGDRYIEQAQARSEEVT